MGVGTEQTIYLGGGTAAAAILRNERIDRGLQGTPMRWYATVISALLGKAIDVTPKKLGPIQAHARGILRGLGYDPETHELVRKKNVFGLGLVVRDLQGHPLRAVREKELNALMLDADFLKAYASEAGEGEDDA